MIDLMDRLRNLLLSRINTTRHRILGELLFYLRLGERDTGMIREEVYETQDASGEDAEDEEGGEEDEEEAGTGLHFRGRGGW